jgi:hypothetical protein
MNFDDNEMWQHSEIMRNFVEQYVNKLEQVSDGAVVEASIEDIEIEPDVPLVTAQEPIKLMDIQERSAALIDSLKKITESASKYNNEKVSYAIEQAIAEIKIISGLDQE